MKIFWKVKKKKLKKANTWVLLGEIKKSVRNPVLCSLNLNSSAEYIQLPNGIWQICESNGNFVKSNSQEIVAENGRRRRTWTYFSKSKFWCLIDNERLAEWNWFQSLNGFSFPDALNKKKNCIILFISLKKKLITNYELQRLVSKFSKVGWTVAWCLENLTNYSTPKIRRANANSEIHGN